MMFALFVQRPQRDEFIYWANDETMEGLLAKYKKLLEQRDDFQERTGEPSMWAHLDQNTFKIIKILYD
jgi:hypothetical protein